MDILQQLIDAFAAQLKAIYLALGTMRGKVAKSYEALTDQPIESPDSGDAEVAAITNELKGSADDLETSVQQSQQP